MESALEEIEFLARSTNRVTVLRLLAEAEYTRPELAGETGVSQATLGRILGDFQDRSWVARDGSTYRATATGRLVASGFEELQDIIDTERRLRDLVPFLPAAALEFDLRHLADATLVTPTRIRPDAPLQRLLELLEGASEVAAVSHAFNEQALSIVATRVADGSMTFEGLFAEAAIEGLRADRELRERLRQLVSHDGASVAVVDDVDVAVMVLDETVCFLIRDADGILRASIDTDARPVRAWARDRIAALSAEAQVVEPVDLGP